MRPNVLIQRLPSLVALVAIGVTGCADERSGPATGSNDGKCFPNGTCNAGLDCNDDSICRPGIPNGTVGGACYNDGTCNPGNVCQGSVCAADTSLPFGTLGGPCFGNGACYEGLVCQDLLCAVNTVPHPGLLGGVCYDNGTCNPGLLCENGACAEGTANGELGGGCLVNGTCRDGLLCVETVCEVDTRLEVGEVGAPCFPNGTCDGGLECVVTSSADEMSAECAVIPEPNTGELDSACWPNGTCNGGLICDLGTCVDSNSAITEPPGQDGGLCFANGTCDDGLVCNSFGKCEPIVVGGLYGACDAAGGCNLGLSCQVSDLEGGRTCLPTVEHLGSIHGVVTDYITNARLANVQVTLVHMGQVEQTATDSLGYYSFDDLSPGHFEITFASADGEHTTRRLGDVTVACNLFTGSEGYDGRFYGDVGYQDQECNQVHDIDLFPFSGSQHGRLWYLNDQEVTPAAGVTVIADFSDLCGCTGDNCDASVRPVRCEGDSCADNNVTEDDEDKIDCPGVDISPDRFIAVTDADGHYMFADLPNTGAIGVRITVMPSVFNGFDYESWGPVFRTLDVFEQDNVEVFLTPQFDPPFIVANNWEDYLYGGFDVSEPIEMTFSRSMKTAGCDIHLAYGQEYKVGDLNRIDTRVPGVLTWSNDNMTATFTPAEPLWTSQPYAVHVHNCESAIDDQEYNWISGNDGGVDGGGDLCCNVEGNACFSSEWNRQDFNTQDGIICSLATDACFGPDDNFEITCNMAPNLDDSAFELYRVVRYPGHNESNPDRELDGAVLVPVTFTPSVDGNTVIIDPTDSLVPTGEYRFIWTVASFIENDTASGINFSPTFPEFCEETETLEFVLANLPVVTMNNGSWSCIENAWVCHAGAQSEVPLTCGGSVKPAANCGYGALETTNGAQDIVMTFTKAVNIALSKVTIENDDSLENGQGNEGDDGIPVDYEQFGLILDATVTADGAVVTVNPAADLPVGTYTVRYVVAAADGLGVAVGHLTFDVVAAPACIAFTGDNLGDRANANYNDKIELDFSAGVDALDERNIIKLVDEFGGEWWPTFTVTNTKDLDDGPCTADPECVVDGRVVVANPNPNGTLSPDRDYTVTFKIYAAASADHVWQGADEAPYEMYPNGSGGFCGGTEHGIYTQPAPITFTTEGHITLVSTTVGTYTDSNNDGYYVPEDCINLEETALDETINCGDFQGSTSFAINGVISLTFTEVPDLSVYHQANFIRLYRFTGGDEENAMNYDLVATSNPPPPVVTGTTVTVSLLPAQTLQSGGELYCIGYQVTSKILIDGQEDVSEAVGELTESGPLNADDPVVGMGVEPQLCFRTAGLTQTAPPTAPTAAPELKLVRLVDSDDTTVNLRFNVLQGAAAGTVGVGTRWYEIYTAAEDSSIEDYLLWNVIEDCQRTLNTTDCIDPNVALTAGPDGARPGFTTLSQQTGETDVCDVVADGSPAFCLDEAPFAGDTVFYRIRACTGSVGDDVAPMCGPYSQPLPVTDAIPPVIEGALFLDRLSGTTVLSTSPDLFVQEGANNSCSTEPLTFNVFLFTSLEGAARPAFDDGTVVSINSLTLGSTTTTLTGIACLPINQPTATGVGGSAQFDASNYDDTAGAWARSIAWPNWPTNAQGFNTTPIMNWATTAGIGSWQDFTAMSIVSFRCTVNAATNPLGVTGFGRINASATDAAGNRTPLVVDLLPGNACLAN